MEEMEESAMNVKRTYKRNSKDVNQSKVIKVAPTKFACRCNNSRGGPAQLADTSNLNNNYRSNGHKVS